MNRAALAWLAVVVPVWLVFVLCTYWEPVMRDGWGHFMWHKNNATTLAGLWEFAKGSYLHNNPRLGQTFTLIQHTPGPWHPLITPVIELAVFYLLATIALGRWPSWRRADDALLVATIIAMAFATIRSLGPMLFYRPFSGNYVFGFMVNLAWAVPYRLHAERARNARWWWTPAMFLLGAASGMCNEHTGPAFFAAGVFALLVYWRRGERVVPWAWAGLVGLAAGALALFFAPGQDIRYSGLATQMSMFERIADRGTYGNGRILLLFAIYTLPLVLWLALAAVARLRHATRAVPRSQQIGAAVALLTGLAIVCTLFASPKQGDRLYFAPVCLCCTGVAAWLVPRLGTLERIVAAVGAGVLIVYASVKLMLAFHTIGAEFRVRIAAIEAAPEHVVVIVPPYSQEKSRWVLGDDFAADTIRFNVAFFYHLAGILVDPNQRVPTTRPADPVPTAP